MSEGFVLTAYTEEPPRMYTFSIFSERGGVCRLLTVTEREEQTMCAPGISELRERETGSGECGVDTLSPVPGGEDDIESVPQRSSLGWYRLPGFPTHHHSILLLCRKYASNQHYLPYRHVSVLHSKAYESIL